MPIAYPVYSLSTPLHMAAWRNGIASDYESGDCRFDPCGGHNSSLKGVFFAAQLIETGNLVLLLLGFIELHS